MLVALAMRKPSANNLMMRHFVKVVIEPALRRTAARDTKMRKLVKNVVTITKKNKGFAFLKNRESEAHRIR